MKLIEFKKKHNVLVLEASGKDIRLMELFSRSCLVTYDDYRSGVTDSQARKNYKLIERIYTSNVGNETVIFEVSFSELQLLSSIVFAIASADAEDYVPHIAQNFPPYEEAISLADNLVELSELNAEE